MYSIILRYKAIVPPLRWLGSVFSWLDKQAMDEGLGGPEELREVGQSPLVKAEDPAGHHRDL
jgi:hypothetical protein